MQTAYQVQTFNDAEASENRIHSDEIAKKFGFEGALVGGVVVFGHLTYLPVSNFGEAWLTNNTAEVRFQKPAYDQQMLSTSMTGDASNNTTTCLNPDDVFLAQLTAEQGSTFDGSLANVPATEYTLTREPISRDNIVLNEALPTWTWEADADTNDAHVKQLRDDIALYQGDNALVHPFWMLRQCNAAFARCFILPAWIHVGSRIYFHQPLRVGDTLEVRTIPTRRWDAKGHEFVTLYIGFLKDGLPMVEVEHTSIYRIAGA